MGEGTGGGGMVAMWEGGWGMGKGDGEGGCGGRDYCFISPSQSNELQTEDMDSSEPAATLHMQCTKHTMSHHLHALYMCMYCNTANIDAALVVDGTRQSLRASSFKR